MCVSTFSSIHFYNISKAKINNFENTYTNILKSYLNTPK